MEDPKKILLSILEEASSKNFTLGKTQLVKLLYLAEVEYYRKTSERLTNLDWLFFHYGPYSLALEPILQEIPHELIETHSGKKFTHYKVAETTLKYRKQIDVKISLLIKYLVGAWGDKPLEQLLDYVYFETEPMQAVDQRGDELDFSTILKEVKPEVIPLKASKEAENKIKDLRKRFEKRLIELSELEPTREEFSDDYKQAIQAWDEEESSGLKNVDKIKLTITRPVRKTETQGN